MTPSSLNEHVIDQAAQWIARMSGPALVADEREKLETWLLADPQHGQELASQAALWYACEDLPPHHREHLIALAESHLRALRFHFRPLRLAAAVLLALILGSGAWLGWQAFDASRVHRIATQTGETHTMSFPDGSVAYLNTRTQLQWTGNFQDRRVTLLQGEALFEVANDPAHPFHVTLGHSEIRVLGTRFNVYLKTADKAAVTVLEGKVEVSAHEAGNLSPTWRREVEKNQSLEFDAQGPTRDVYPTLALNAVKWREGLLKINDEPLSDALDELMRYTDRRIVVTDPRLAQAHVAAVLNVRNVPAALERLEKLAPIEVTDRGDAWVLSLKSPSSSPSTR